jgi:hypothetical protein
MKLKFMIMGYARHGKDTVAEIMQNSLGLKFVSSSFAAADKIMMPYFASKGVNYASVDQCYADRVNHRAEWYDQIKAYHTHDLARLAREIYKDSDVYVGIRDEEQLKAAHDEGLFDYSIWVDRSKHAPPEPTSSNTVTWQMADYVIDNNGTLEELKVKVLSLYWDLVSLEYAGGYTWRDKT